MHQLIACDKINFFVPSRPTVQNGRNIPLFKIRDGRSPSNPRIKEAHSRRYVFRPGVVRNNRIYRIYKERKRARARENEEIDKYIDRKKDR